MAQLTRVWICKPDGTEFTGHVLATGTETLCGIQYYSLPVIKYINGKEDEDGNRDWYADHERDDAVDCGDCLGYTVRDLLSRDYILAS